MGLLSALHCEGTSSGLPSPCVSTPALSHKWLSTGGNAWRSLTATTSFLSSSFSSEELPEGAQPTHPIKEPVGVQTLACTATGRDVRWQGNLARVVCPAHCEREPSVVAVGSGVHPIGSPVCMGAIVDRVLPVYGGEMMLQKAAPVKGFRGTGKPVGLESYSGAETDVAVSISATGLKGESWQAYATDSIDMPKALPPEHVIEDCPDTFDSLPLKSVGESVVVNCPGRCQDAGKLAGTLLYSPDSSVCWAAEHAKVIGRRGGRALVTLRHGQNEFYGSQEGDHQSSDAPGADKSFTVALPTADIMARMSIDIPKIADFL